MILVDEDDTRARPSGGQGCGEPSRSGPDDQHVAEREGLVVSVGIRRMGGPAEAGGAADHRLVELLPQSSRPHECLVVEARRENRRRQGVDREGVVFQRRPAILARRLKPLVQFGHGGTGVRLPARARTQFDEGVRLFRTGGEDAARAVVLERPGDEAHAVGQQRRGQGIALKTAVALAVEGEVQGAAPVDHAAGRGTKALPNGRCRGGGIPKGERGHATSPVRRLSATSRAEDTPVISWVRVSRSTTSQERQPAP